MKCAGFKELDISSPKDFENGIDEIDYTAKDTKHFSVELSKEIVFRA
jgi:hypothetical protein